MSWDLEKQEKENVMDKEKKEKEKEENLGFRKAAISADTILPHMNPPL